MVLSPLVVLANVFIGGTVIGPTGILNLINYFAKSMCGVRQSVSFFVPLEYFTNFYKSNFGVFEG